MKKVSKVEQLSKHVDKYVAFLCDNENFQISHSSLTSKEKLEKVSLLGQR